MSKLCPVCGNALKNLELRVSNHIAFSSTGSVSLSPCMETILRAVLRSPGELNSEEIGDLTGTSYNTVRQHVYQLRLRLWEIGWEMPLVNRKLGYVVRKRK